MVEREAQGVAGDGRKGRHGGREERRQRLAQTLRDNLKRRKDQARARAGEGPGGGAAAPGTDEE